MHVALSAPIGSMSLDSQSPMDSLRIQFPCHLKGAQDFTACSLFAKRDARGSAAFSRFPLRENAVERQKGVRGEASV